MVEIKEGQRWVCNISISPGRFITITDIVRRMCQWDHGTIVEYDIDAIHRNFHLDEAYAVDQILVKYGN